MSDRLQQDKRRGGGGSGELPVSPSASPSPSGEVGGFRRGRRASADVGLGRECAATDPDLRARYPAIHEYLTRRVVEGKVIETSTLLLFCEEGQFKVCLNDRDAAVVVFRGGQSFQDALGGLENALIDGTADWRERKNTSRR